MRKAFFYVNLILLSITVSCGSCKSQESAQENVEESKPISLNQSTSTYNKSETMILEVERAYKKGDPATQLTYAVYSLPDRTLLKEGTYRGMDVSWHDNNSIRLTPYVGMVEKPTIDDQNKENKKDKGASYTIIQIKEEQ